MFIKELFDRPRDTEDLPNIDNPDMGETTAVSKFSDSGGDEYKIHIKDTVDYFDPAKYHSLKPTKGQEVQVKGADIEFEVLNQGVSQGKHKSPPKIGLEVLSTVMNKLRQYIVKNKPNVVSFTIHGNSTGVGRQRHESLLRALVKKIQREFKYEDMEKINTIGYDNMDAHYYLFHKKPSWKFGLRELLSSILNKK